MHLNIAFDQYAATNTVMHQAVHFAILVISFWTVFFS